MKIPAKIGFLWLALLPFSFSAMAINYTWTGAAPGVPKFWSNPANWLPSSGFPILSGDRAFFNRNSNAPCMLTMKVAIAELNIDSSYAGTITLTFNGQIDAERILLDGGILVGEPEKVTATSILNVSAGIFADLTCLGTATVTGGNITVLRMRGPESRLQAAGGSPDPRTLGSLLVPNGSCLLSQAFAAGTLVIDVGATLVLDRLSSLSTAINNIAGSIRMGSGSALVFLSDANITGALDASAPGSAITCYGNWSATGTFVPSGSIANSLVIAQTNSPGTVNHGSNSADAVTIRGALGQKTTWVTSNTIQQLTISLGTTLEINPGIALRVPGAIVNAGVLREIAPGRVRHDADELKAINNSEIAIQALPVNGSFRLLLRDADEALRADVPDIAEGISILNIRNGDLLRLNAVETGASSTVFITAPIVTQNAVDAVADNLLQLLPGDTITISYVDNEDPEDNKQAFNIRAETGSTTIPASTSTTTTSTIATTSTITTSSSTSTTTTVQVSTTVASTTTTVQVSTTTSSTTTTTLTPLGPSSRLEFAQLAAGGGYQSFLVINNPNANAVQGLAAFRSQDGQPLPLLVNGELNSSVLFVVPGRGVIRIRLQSSGEQVRVGWCRVIADGPIGGLLVYQLVESGILVSEASVPPSIRLKHFSIPVTQMGYPSETGLAIANVDNDRADISLRFLATDGRLVDQAAIQRETGGQFARFAVQLFTGVTPGTEGSIEVFSTKEIIAAGLIFHGSIFTALPVLPLP